MIFRRKWIQPTGWSGRGKPRVLLENPDGEAAFVGVWALRQAGYEVATCPGPIQPGLRPRACPLCDPDRGCPLVEDADVVVTSLALDRAETRNVVLELRALRPWKPLVIEVSPDDARRHAGLLEGHDVLLSPAEPDELVAKVEEVLTRA